MAQNWMDNGTVLALGTVALLGVAGVARAGWKGEFGGDIDLPFFGARGGVKSQVRFGSRRTGLRAVPTSIKKTPRSRATGTYVFPSTRDFPIGDLYHARLALIYAMAPSHAGQRATIRRAVAARWPQYDWDTWWAKKMAAKRKRGKKKRGRKGSRRR